MGYPDFEKRPMGERVWVARFMAMSKTRYPHAKPHAYCALDIDMQAVEELVDRYGGSFRKAVGAALLSDLFYMWWLTRAAEQWPRINALHAVTETDSKGEPKRTEIREYRSVNLGVAVAPVGQPLVTVAITEAEKKSFGELAVLLSHIYYRCSRAPNIKQALLPGLEVGTSTITFNNFGALGPEYGFGIIEPGASLILSVGAPRSEVSWERNTAEPSVPPQLLFRRPSFVSVSFDHRVLDGKDVSDLLRSLQLMMMSSDANERLILESVVKTNK